MSGTTAPAAPTAGPAQRGLRLIWPIALLVLGAMMLATAWHRWTISLLFALAAAVPLLALRGLLRAGLSRWFATAILLLVSIMAAYLATSGAGLSLEETVRDVIPRLLTSPLPYSVQADLLVGPLLLVTLVSLLVGLRVDGRQRVEPVIGAAVLYVAGALLTAGHADPWGLVAVLMLVVAILGWVFLDEHSEPVRQRLSVAGPVAVVGVGTLAALATLPVSNAFEPRDLVDPPVYEVVASNPLTQLGAWANNPTDELLHVRGAEVPLRLVVLDKYDGTQWTAATRYEELPADGRTGLRSGSFAHPDTVQVQFSRLGGNWLPSPGMPTSIALDGALIDRGTGTLYSREDTAGLAYEVTGAFEDPPQDRLITAQLPQSGMKSMTELPPLPRQLGEFARQLGEGAATPYERATRIETLVRSKYQLSPTAISGSALWRIQQFLLGKPGETGARIGTSEQFATAFAVLARANGLPARVVVGFRPGETQEDGTRIIHGSDAFAWAEVYFAELGWVPFSPAPDDDTFHRERPVEAEEPTLPGEADTGTPTPEPSASETTGPGGADGADGTDDGPGMDGDADAMAPTSGGRIGLDPYLVAGGAAGAVVLLLVALRAGRRVRHARRGARGAWAEVLDALHLSGLRAAPHLPADVVAAQTDTRFGITAASPIADRALRARFAPDRPSAPTPGSATRAQLKQVRRSARRSIPWWRRWWWHLDPRVLGRRG
ncbi:transglutaminase family protein [Nocardioides sp. GXZ039]|uniref:transglutaminase family protein n=1 Tax=Nocardioides sp. GXZ039 TaxID=3136018 RepID=UPI0030F3A848